MSVLASSKIYEEREGLMYFFEAWPNFRTLTCQEVNNIPLYVCSLVFSCFAQLKLLISCAFENVLKQRRLEPGITHVHVENTEFMKTLTGHKFYLGIFFSRQ